MSGSFRSTVVGFASVLLCAVVVASAAEAPALPTQKDIEQAYAQKQYPQALSMIARVLAVKPDAVKAAGAAPVNRHKLLEIKGEILLRQKMHSEAAIAFDNASDETKDPKLAAVDEATTALIKKSTVLGYTPKGKDKKAAPATAPAAPIDIVEMDSRKQAFKAFFADAKATDEPSITAAISSKALPDVLVAVPKAGTLHSLEIAATGSDETTNKMTKSLAAHAKQLLDDALSTMQTKTDEIKTKATEYLEIKESKPPAKGQKNAQVVSRWKERGLTAGEAPALQDVIRTTEKIDPACATLSKDFPEQKADWAAIKTKADSLHKLAQSVLSANYSKVTDKKP